MKDIILFIILLSPYKLASLLDVYNFSVTSINGENISLEKYRGFVTLIVNVASQCGYTDNQYKGLVELYDKLKNRNKFEILAFPCNQFWEQEPDSNPKILHFAQTKYGAQFPIFSKVDIILRGWEKVDPLWQYIGEMSSPPTWNFWKYIVDANGKVVSSYGPQTLPSDLYVDIIKEMDNINGIPLKVKNDTEKMEL